MADRRHISEVRRAAAKRSAEVRAAPPSGILRVRREAIAAARKAAERSKRSLVDWASYALLEAASAM